MIRIPIPLDYLDLGLIAKFLQQCKKELVQLILLRYLGAYLGWFDKIFLPENRSCLYIVYLKQCLNKYHQVHLHKNYEWLEQLCDMHNCCINLILVLEVYIPHLLSIYQAQPGLQN